MKSRTTAADFYCFLLQRIKTLVLESFTLKSNCSKFLKISVEKVELVIFK